MIKDLEIAQVYNTVKERTIKVSIRTEKGTFSASAPSGTSAGKYEAAKLDVKSVIKNFSKIRNLFIGNDEGEIDKAIDIVGVNRVGANFSIALSIACVRALSGNNAYRFFNKNVKTFPIPLGNVVGGGAHKGYTSEQEFLLLPLKAKTIKEAVETNQSIWKEVGIIIRKKKILTGTNYEGAWTCRLSDIGTLDMLSDLAEDYGTSIGIDFAASQFFKNGKYIYKNPVRRLSPGEQLDFVLDLIKSYRLDYVEDPFNENDFNHFAELTRKAKCLITGDDLFVTNPDRLKMGIKKGAGNAIIIKPDQIGTVSKTMETIRIAKKFGYKTIVSHRSRDTTDSFISDLALGTSSPIIKCGIHGKERTAKLNRLIKIWNRTKKPRMPRISL